MRFIICLLTLLVLVGCDRSMHRCVNPHGDIKVVMSGMMSSETAGQWDAENRIIYLSTMNINKWTLAHEIAHAADTVGNYELAFNMVGYIDPKHGLSNQLAVAVQVKNESLKYSGRFAHWMALYKLFGTPSVGHSEIMSEIRKLDKSK